MCTYMEVFKHVYYTFICSQFILVTFIVLYIPLYKRMVSKRLRTEGEVLTQNHTYCSEFGSARFLLS